MASEKTRQRRQLAAKIQRLGNPTEQPCVKCFRAGQPCLIMASQTHVRCANCVRLGRACIGRSWTVLERTLEEYRRKVEKDETELAALLARMAVNKRLLRQAEEATRANVQYLGDDTETIEDISSSDNDAHTFLEIAEDSPPTDWMAFAESTLDNTIDSLSGAAEV